MEEGKGREPPFGQDFILMQFSEKKVGQIVGWRPTLSDCRPQEMLDPPLLSLNRFPRKMFATFASTET